MIFSVAIWTDDNFSMSMDLELWLSFAKGNRWSPHCSKEKLFFLPVGTKVLVPILFSFYLFHFSIPLPVPFGDLNQQKADQKDQDWAAPS